MQTCAVSDLFVAATEIEVDGNTIVPLWLFGEESMAERERFVLKYLIGLIWVFCLCGGPKWLE